ncbi:DsbA family protein [Chryseobacterium sp. X308]|uniref:DsbA family protein n=1 Tax=Chryseobacterium sp. X308 TaxID=2884873 RepID=UPI001D151ED2|nr:DsbA family protein [Chryseobacterium sp. X308]MCC3215608.1 DsbA family protein [Chryseobacterium sp. X308]
MKLYYFTDPMCSWCYGFSPVMKKLKESYPDIDLQIISGGFAPGSTQKVTKEYKDFLAYHWRSVSLRSGQYFDHSMKFVSDSFHYDTEPSSRALVVVQRFLPEKDFEFLSLMQKSFYVEGKDITNDGVLAELAEELGIEKKTFLEGFHSEEIKLKTAQGFQFSRQLGVKGFPTLLTLENGTVKVLTHGFQSFESLKEIIEERLTTMFIPESFSGQSCSDISCEC